MQLLLRTSKLALMRRMGPCKLLPIFFFHKNCLFQVLFAFHIISNSLFVSIKRTSVGGSLGFATDKSFSPSVGSGYPAGERSLTFTSKSDREDDGKVIALKSWIFLDEDFQVARAVNQNYNLNSFNLITSTNLLYIKISKDEFENGIKKTLEDINTVESLPFPMTRACLGSGEIFHIV